MPTSALLKANPTRHEQNVVCTIKLRSCFHFQINLKHNHLFSRSFIYNWSIIMFNFFTGQERRVWMTTSTQEAIK